MVDGWLGHRRALAESDAELEKVLEEEALPLIGEPLFVWRDGVPLPYSREAILERPAEEVSIVGSKGMVRWRYYREAAAVVLVLDHKPQEPAGYSGERLEWSGDDADDTRVLLWGRREGNGRYVEGRIVPAFDYAELFAPGARSGEQAALALRTYKTGPPVREVSRLVGIEPWRGAGGA